MAGIVKPPGWRAMIGLLLLQAAAGQPDIELNLQARIKSVRIERRGEARLEVRGEGPGNRVEVRIEPKPEGRTELRNVTVNVHAEATVGDPAQIRVGAETGTPQ
jgi:Fe2+ transport system protein FeoA